MIIGIVENPCDYWDNIQAIREDSRFDVKTISQFDCPNIDVLILEGIWNLTRLDILSKYASKTTIIWQSGIWPREVNSFLVSLIGSSDYFMCYDDYVETLVGFMGKKIWKHFPLFNNKFDIIKEFNTDRWRYPRIYSANLFHPGKLGYSMLCNLSNYVIYINNLWGQENVLSVKIPGIEYRPFVTSDKFREQMDSDCKIIFQFAEQVAWGRNILDAVRLGIPSISNTFYQRIFYPDLFCASIKEALTMLEWDYKTFKPHVDNAQAILKNLLFANAKQHFTDYLWSAIS